MCNDTLRQQPFHKKFAFHDVILITHQKIVKREADAVHELDKCRSTRSQKIKQAPHLRHSRSLKQFKLIALHWKSSPKRFITRIKFIKPQSP